MRRFLAAAALCACAVVLAGGASAGGNGNQANGTTGPSDEFGFLTHNEVLMGQPVLIAPEDATGAGSGVGPGQQGKSSVFCGASGEAGRGAFDKDISCDDAFAPDNETPVKVDPANPKLVLGGSNDYQLNFVGSTLNEQIPSGWYLSEDGGGTWIDGNLPMKGDLGGGDPVPGFNDKFHELVFASLSFVCGQLAPVCTRGNVEFASAPMSQLSGDASKDRVQWSDQTVVNGDSSDVAAQQIFLDKLWMAVDNTPTSAGYGNMYITFTKFRFEKLAYDESPIWLTMSTDGGKRWSDPVEISGRNPRFCTFQSDPNDPDTDNSSSPSNNATAEGPDDPTACDENQFSYPYVAPDGTLFVTFQNEQNQAAWEIPQTFDDQVMVVRGTPTTSGSMTFSGEAPTPANQAGCVRVQGQAAGTPAPGFSNPCVVPVHVANLEDSNDNTSHVEGGPTAVPDFPLNVRGRTTLTGHQFRYNSSSNLVVAKASGGTSSDYRVYVFWSDNAAGIIPGSATPVPDPANPGQTLPLPVPITNTNTYYAYSDDRGNTWAGGDQALTSPTPDVAGSGPLCVTGDCPELATRLTVPSDSSNAPDTSNTQCGVCSDQFYPFADSNPSNGAVAAGWMEGGVGAPRSQYGFAVSTTGPTVLGVAPTFSTPTLVSSAFSNPNNSRFFRARTDTCFDCATFIGDYNGVAYGSDGSIHASWTDMRKKLATVQRPAGCGTATTPPCTPVDLFGEDDFYARIPPPGP
jgi:hypothetical protein